MWCSWACMYLTTVLGNLLVILATSFDPQLHLHHELLPLQPVLEHHCPQDAGEHTVALKINKPTKAPKVHIPNILFHPLCQHGWLLPCGHLPPPALHGHHGPPALWAASFGLLGSGHLAFFAASLSNIASILLSQNGDTPPFSVNSNWLLNLPVPRLFSVILSWSVVLPYWMGDPCLESFPLNLRDHFFIHRTTTAGANIEPFSYLHLSPLCFILQGVSLFLFYKHSGVHELCG